MTTNISLQVTQSKDCTKFYFFDSTPLYNAISSSTGYDPTGVSNLNPSAISMPDTVLVITKPDGTNTTIDFVSGDKSITRLIADTRNLVQKTITYSDLGYSSKLADGVYKFLYLPYNDTTGYTYSTSCYIINDCQACCCLDSKLKSIKFCSTCKDQFSKETKDLFDLYLKRSTAQLLAACGDYTGAQTALDYISNLCASSACDSCS